MKPSILETVDAAQFRRLTTASWAAFSLGAFLLLSVGCSSGTPSTISTGTSTGQATAAVTSSGATSSGTGRATGTGSGGSSTGGTTTGAPLTGTVTTPLSGDPFNSCRLGDGGYFNPESLLLRPEGLYVAGEDVDLVSLDGSGVSLVMTHSIFSSIGIAGAQAGPLFAFTTGTQGGCEIDTISASGATFYLGSQQQLTCQNGVPADGGASFGGMTAFAADSNGSLFVAESGFVAPDCSVIRQIDPDRVTSTLAGDGVNAFKDGASSAAEFNAPTGIALDSKGNLYVADSQNNAIRKIASGTVTTLAGTTSAGFDDGSGGPNGNATFHQPISLAVDGAGNVYVADSQNYAVRIVAPDGTTTTLAGNGQPGTANGTLGRAGGAQFTQLLGIAVDSAGKTVYVGDGCSLRVIAIDR